MGITKIIPLAALALASAFDAAAQTDAQVKAWQETINSYQQPADSSLNTLRIAYIKALNDYGDFVERKTDAEQTLRLSGDNNGFEAMQQSVDSTAFWQSEQNRIDALKKVEQRRGIRPAKN